MKMIEDMVLDVSDIATETAIVHTLPPIGPRCHPLPAFRFVPTASLTMQDIAYGPAVTVITSTAPIAGQELDATREMFAEWLEATKTASLDEGGDGILLGYDPISPATRIPASEIGLTNECLFTWNRAPGEAPIFEWSQVAHSTFQPESARLFLVNGRVVSLHADVDWWNRLS